MIGRLLGHYRIVEQIGSGGMGIVYRARDERLERDVAIKVLSDAALSGDSADRIRHEALALSRASHPAIATIHDLDVDAGVHYLVMEYIPGENLSDRLEAGPLPEAEVVRLGRELTAGLDAAHRHGIVHRDLKPGNLRLTPDGHLKILDFGIAHRSAQADAVTRRTQGAGALGTLPYMAPEQARGAAGDARSDIFAVGAVLYEMATGRRAHHGEHDAAVLDAVLHRTPKTPRELGHAVSPQLQACIFKALDKDPERRYQTARELGIDLARTADPGAATPSTYETRPPAPSLARRWLPAAFAALVLAMISATLIDWRQPSPAPPDGDLQGRLKLAVLPAQVPGLGPGEWSTLVQTLLADQLTGLQDVGVLDSLSLNSLLGDEAASRPAQSRSRLRAGGVGLVIETQVAAVANAFELRASVVDVAEGERRFSTRSVFAEESTLPRAIDEVAEEVVAFLQVQLLHVGRDKSLRPWIANRNQNFQAVKAFLQASDYIFRHQSGEGERYLRRAIELDPSYTAPRIWLISGLLDRGQRAEAEEQYKLLLALEPTVSPFEQTMIAFHGAQLRGNAAEAIRHLEVALTYSPGNNILLMNLGGLMARQGNCPGALGVLDPLVAARWPYPRLYSIWGYCAISEGRLQEALQALKGSLAITPVEPTIYPMLEALLVASDRPDEAARYGQLRKGGAGGSRGIATLYERLAEQSMAAGAPARGVTLLQRALAEFPKEARYHDRLGDALLAAGRTAEAEKAYHDALASDPAWVRANLGLGEIAERRQDRAKAAEHYRAVIAKAEGKPEAATARERLDRIDKNATNR